MKVILLTSGKVDYKLHDLSLYESVMVTARGERFPNIVCSHKEIEKAVSRLVVGKLLIVSATSSQAKETAVVIGRKFEVNVIYDDNFLPLKFNLSSLVGEEEFYRLEKKAFDELRKRFLNAFYDDKLIDSHNIFKDKYRKLVKIAKNNPSKTILVVSHSYLIQLFSIYNEVGNEMFKNKKLLFKHFDPSKPYGFLRKIELDISYN